jgi:hypothetical protein
MRELLMAFVVLACPAALRAQSCEPGGMLMAGMAPGRVAVTMKAGERLKGTLICVDRDLVVLGDGERIHNLPLADVTSIVKPRDSLWNGIAIGAAVGLLAGVMTYGEAQYAPGGRDASYVLAPAAVYAAIGAAVDALHGSSWTIYAAAPRNTANAPMLGARVRF